MASEALKVGFGGFGDSAARSINYAISRRFQQKENDRQAGFEERRVALAEEENARRRRLFDFEIEQAQREVADQQTVARSDAAESRRKGMQTAAGNEYDELAERVNRAWTSGDPIGQKFATIGMHAMESLGSLAEAGAYLSRVEGPAAAIQSPEAREHYLDTRLAVFEEKAFDREAAELQRDLVRMIDTGALAGVMGGGQPAGASGSPKNAGPQGESLSGQSAQQAGGDAGSVVMAMLDELAVGRSMAADASDYQALRGAIRQIRATANGTAAAIAGRKSELEKTLVLSEKYRKMGTELAAAGSAQGLRYIDLANALPALSPTARDKRLAEFEGFRGDEVEMMPPEQIAMTSKAMGARADQAALASAETGGDAGDGKSDIRNATQADLAASARARGISGSEVSRLKGAEASQAFLGRDTSAVSKKRAQAEQRASKMTEGPGRAAKLDADLRRVAGHELQPIEGGAEAWVEAFETAIAESRRIKPGASSGRGVEATAYRAAQKLYGELIDWALMYGDERTRAAARVARGTYGLGQEEDPAEKYRAILGKGYQLGGGR